MLTAIEIIGICRTPNSDHGVSFGTIVTEDVTAWIERFIPEKRFCEICGRTNLYSREDLKYIPLADGKGKENIPDPSS